MIGKANIHLAPPARAAGSDQAPPLDSSLELVSATHLLRPPAGTGGAIATDDCSRNLGMMAFLYANLISLLLMLVMTMHETSFPFPQRMVPSRQASALSVLCAGMSVSTAFGVREGECVSVWVRSKQRSWCMRARVQALTCGHATGDCGGEGEALCRSTRSRFITFEAKTVANRCLQDQARFHWPHPARRQRFRAGFRKPRRHRVARALLLPQQSSPLLWLLVR